MDLHKATLSNKIAKILAGPLSLLFANKFTSKMSRMIEAYICFLLGKGAGTGWGLESEVKAARALIKDSEPIIFDIGANIGEWSEMMKKVMPESKIFIFEPQPTCRKYIEERQLPNTVLIPCAVSSKIESTRMFTSGAADKVASLHTRGDSYFRDYDFKEIQINTTTIDQVVSDYKISKIDFLKMDIEGHEFEALKGGINSLKNGIIRALSFEFGSGNINSNTYFRDFWKLLSPLGFKIYRILPSSGVLLIDRYYEDCEYFRGATNYLAVKD